MIRSTKAVIVNDGRYLLVRRSDGSKAYKGAWEFPGGKLDDGESLEAGLRRETLEETNLVVGALGNLRKYNHSDKERTVEFNFFLVEDFRGDVVLSDEHTDYEWVSEEELDNYKLTPVAKHYFGL
tara:strand:- start:727 stop:1101 length:375 start_codon:yes stop_codon:yes gene_type:complete